MPKANLIEDINDWMRRAGLGDDAGLKDGGRISTRDLRAICTAISQCCNPTPK